MAGRSVSAGVMPRTRDRGARDQSTHSLKGHTFIVDMLLIMIINNGSLMRMILNNQLI